MPKHYKDGDSSLGSGTAENARQHFKKNADIDARLNEAMGRSNEARRNNSANVSEQQKLQADYLNKRRES